MGSRSSQQLGSTRLLVLGLWVGCAVPQLPAQVADQIVVTSADAGIFKPVIRRFDRRLKLLGSTPLSPETSNAISSVETAIAVLPSGDIWIPIDPLNQKKLVRLDSAGNFLPTVVLGDYPVQIAASGFGLVYALTRLPLVIPEPVYAVGFDGAIQWSNVAGPSSYTGSYPDRMAIASNGDLWIGDFTYGACGCMWGYPELTLLDAATGDIVRKVALPYTATPPALTILGHIAGDAEGKIWVTTQGDFQSWLHHVDGHSSGHGIEATFAILGSYNGATNQIRVDAHGDIWVPGVNAQAGGAYLYKYSHDDGSVLSTMNMGGGVIGYALGASGEELFAVRANGSAFDRRLVRLNLITGRTSSIVIDPPFTSSGIGNGDPTGFIWANVLDQGGDNDGDGATNRQETLAGTSPYDPTSRPQGPKIYIDFAQSNNAIVLKLSDPDGLLNPTGGLSVPSLSVKVGAFGEVFPILLKFLTFVQVSPDGTQATAFFGALPFATGAKLTVDASVADKTGAIGWDWQVTPPGDL
jgi:hypothetical protein